MSLMRAWIALASSMARPFEKAIDTDMTPARPNGGGWYYSVGGQAYLVFLPGITALAKAVFQETCA